MAFSALEPLIALIIRPPGPITEYEGRFEGGPPCCRFRLKMFAVPVVGRCLSFQEGPSLRVSLVWNRGNSMEPIEPQAAAGFPGQPGRRKIGNRASSSNLRVPPAVAGRPPGPGP